MARVVVGEDEVRVELGRWERLAALHDSLVVPVDHVTGVAAVPDVRAELRGVRAPGTGVPGLLMLGTTRHAGERDFCVVYRHGPGVVLTLRGEEFARALVSLPAAEAQLAAAAVEALLHG